MSGKKEKPYPSEFKESSVKLALESKDPITHTANNLGVKTSTLHTWISKYTKPKEPNVRTDEHIYDEVRKLKKELAKVTEERDLLKKAVVSSSGHSNILSYNKKDKGLDENEITKLFWFFNKPTNRSMVKVETR